MPWATRTSDLRYTEISFFHGTTNYFGITSLTPLYPYNKFKAYSSQKRLLLRPQVLSFLVRKLFAHALIS